MTTHTRGLLAYIPVAEILFPNEKITLGHLEAIRQTLDRTKGINTILRPQDCKLYDPKLSQILGTDVYIVYGIKD